MSPCNFSMDDSSSSAITKFVNVCYTGFGLPATFPRALSSNVISGISLDTTLSGSADTSFDFESSLSSSFFLLLAVYVPVHGSLVQCVWRSLVLVDHCVFVSNAVFYRSLFLAKFHCHI